jgi:hypothetical protein
MVYKKLKHGRVEYSKNPIAHILSDKKKEQVIESKETKETKGGSIDDLGNKLKNITLSSNNNSNQETKTNTKLDRFINFKL